MAHELLAQNPTGLTLYALVLNAAGQVWRTDTSVFEPPVTADWASYPVALTESGTTGLYRGDFPAVAAGVYPLLVYRQLAGSPAATDALVGQGEREWSGTAVVSLASRLAAADYTEPPTVEEIADAIGEGSVTVYGEDGAVEWTYTVYQPGGVTPIAGATVYVSADLAGASRSGAKVSDSLGQVRFRLNPIDPLYVFRSHPDWLFDDPDVESVEAP